MKKIKLFILLIAFTKTISAQIEETVVDTTYMFPVNDSIASAIAITDEISEQFIDYWSPIDTSIFNTENVLWYWVYSNGELPAIEFHSEGGFRELTIYGPFTENYEEAQELIQNGQAVPYFTNVTWIEPLADTIPTEVLEIEGYGLDSLEFDTAYFDNFSEIGIDSTFHPLIVGETSFHDSLVVDQLTEVGLYILRVGTYLKTDKVTIESEGEIQAFASYSEVIHQPGACVECIDGELPIEDVYLVSAWVSMEGADPATTSYDGPRIVITTSLGTTSIVPSEERYIIDGWQLMEGEFEIPSGNTIFEISLFCGDEEGEVCYFDDIRFQPRKASMKTYVYDPANLRLVAELDERHYSTFYEYDEEGQLKRIKKETERGIKTIQETTSKTKNQ